MIYLKIVEHNKLLNFLFKTNVSEFNLHLEDLLQHHFTKLDKNLYKININKINKLNDILTNLKDQFLNSLGVAPVPLTFLLVKSLEKLPDFKILRSGKIYLESGLKSKIENELKQFKIFYKIQPWNGLWELVFSATVDPKLKLFFKDIFWTDKYSFCFFCNTTWHNFTDCPGLSVPEPRMVFDKALELNFTELAQTLWEGITKENFSSAKLKYFYTRHFYLLPEFLKIIFFKGEEINSWSALKLNIQPPVRGGSLGIGLEALIKKDLNTAEKKFKEVEEDFRANIGLFFLNFLKGDIVKSFYYLEDALSKKLNNFVRSYLILYKGYVKEIQGDDISALELYKKAFEIDRTCLPAFYRWCIIKYKREESSIEEILDYFNHPYLIYWSYLEPLFIKDQKIVEQILEKKFLEKREIASQRLKEAEDLYFKLKDLMSEDEKQDYESQLKTIGEKIHNGGIGVIEKASDNAMDLALELRAYVYNKLKIIQKNFAEIQQDYNYLALFWKKYPYKHEDVIFGNELKTLSDLINKISTFLNKKDLTDCLAQILSNLKICEEKLNLLKELKEKLNKKWIFRKRLADFLKAYSILESFLVFIYAGSSFLSLENLENFLNFPMFLLLSFLFLVICLIISYLKHYE